MFDEKENKNKSSEEKVETLIEDIESIGIFKVEKKEDGELKIKIKK